MYWMPWSEWRTRPSCTEDMSKAQEAMTAKPNIIFILTYDQPENTLSYMPNIQRRPKDRGRTLHQRLQCLPLVLPFSGHHPAGPVRPQHRHLRQRCESWRRLRNLRSTRPREVEDGDLGSPYEALPNSLEQNDCQYPACSGRSKRSTSSSQPDRLPGLPGRAVEYLHRLLHGQCQSLGRASPGLRQAHSLRNGHGLPLADAGPRRSPGHDLETASGQPRHRTYLRPDRGRERSSLRERPQLLADS
jgi:hypothetical protein